MIELHADTTGNSQRVAIALEEVEPPYRAVRVDIPNANEPIQQMSLALKPFQLGEGSQT